jgi:uncharacterized membrane protein
MPSLFVFLGGGRKRLKTKGSVGPCATYLHEHPPVRNVNTEFEKRLTPGQIIADRVAAVVGSWPFIIIQSLLLVAWMAVNALLAVIAATHPEYLKAWDPYPFILLNLVLSFQAAYTGPIVMMSQNRQAEKDRLTAQQDYEVNQKAEEEIKIMMQHLLFQDEQILRLSEQIATLQTRVAGGTAAKKA